MPNSVLILANVPLDSSSGSGKVIYSAKNILESAGFRTNLMGIADGRVGKLGHGRRYALLAAATVLGVIWVIRCRPNILLCFGGDFGLLTYLVALWPRSMRPQIVQYSNGVESHAEMWQTKVERESGHKAGRWYQKISLSKIYDLAFTHSDHVVTVSQFDKDYLVYRNLCRPDSVSVIENTLPDYYLSRSPNTERQKIIGFCGAWGTRKNVHLIARDVGTFLRDNPDWRFEAMGPDTDLGVVSAMPEMVRMGRALGHGFKSDQEQLEWYEKLAIFILPSVYEAFGFVTVEALACGCAVIATKSAGFAESLENGREVLLIESYKSPSLHNALKQIASDSELRKRIAKGGFSVVQRLTAARAADQLEAVCRKLLVAQRSVVPPT